MRSPWPARVLLPAAQALAEGSWAGRRVRGGAGGDGSVPVDRAAGVRRHGRRGHGLGAPPALALRDRRGVGAAAAGAGGGRLLLAAGPRRARQPGRRPADRRPQPARAGWLGAVAFWRGEVHRSIEDDDVIQDRLLRWVLPGLAIPWLVGHATSSGAIEEAFTSAAFVGTVFFIGSAFTAMGLSRLEAVRVVTGSDWRSNRSWVVLVVGIAIVMTLLAAPAAAFLGVPAKALLAAVVGPIQTLLFVLVLLFTPVILLGALLADLVQPLLPEGFGLGQIQPPTTIFNARDAASNWPSIHLLRHPRLAPRVRAVRAGRDAVDAPPGAAPHASPWPARPSRSARSSSRPPAREREAQPAAARRAAPLPLDDPAGAYLAALNSLDRDGRWARRGTRPRPRTPAHPGRGHGRRRVRASGGRLPAGSATARCRSPNASDGVRHPACEHCASGWTAPDADQRRRHARFPPARGGVTHRSSSSSSQA